MSSERAVDQRVRCNDCRKKISMSFIENGIPRCLSCSADRSRRHYWAGRKKEKRSILQELEDEKAKEDPNQTKIEDWS